MQFKLRFIFTICLLACISLATSSIRSQQHQDLGATALTQLSLRNLDGTAEDWDKLANKDYIVFVFLGTECPLAKLYLPRLDEISKQYADIARVVGIDSNTQDTLAEIQAYVEENKVSFPILKDTQGQLSIALEAERTPEVFILDRSGTIFYQGRVDDQYGVGYSRETARQEDLKRALNELRQGQLVSVPQTKPVGCFIGRTHQSQKNTNVTYHNKVSPILQKHCVECHQQGEIAPFSLTQYEDASAWAETIGEVIEQGRMPPWHANPHYGSFSNARHMSEEEKKTIALWIQEGCPRGEDSSTTKQQNKKNNSGWQFRKDPDRIIPMRPYPFTVPAEGTVEYQYFVVDPQFTEDRWVSAAEVLPGNREVVHHAIVFISTPDQETLNNSGWLAAYVPGQRLTPLKEGQARKIPAGSQLIFQMHYTPNGSVENDQTKIGLVFIEEEEVQEEVITLITANRHFKIPPQASDHQVVSKLTEFPSKARLTALVPHMHLRGKSFRIIYHADSGNKEILLDVPQYDFNWQHVYRLKKPLFLDQADHIQCIAHFDNSENNIVNPDPEATVRWGDQSWEEMMIAFFEVTIPHQSETSLKENNDSQTQAKILAAQWIKDRDADKDSHVQPEEVTDAFRRFAFSQIDRNNDQKINLEETISHISETLSEEQRKQDLQKQLDQLK